MEAKIVDRVDSFLGDWYIPDIRIVDLLEIIIVAYLVYKLVVWIKNTKAWMLLKGMLVLGAFILVASILKMNTILWIAKNSINVLATAAIIVFQPELRRALEHLGKTELWSSILPFERTATVGKYDKETIDAIVTSCFEMAEVKTGALIVVEQEQVLTEYQQTGIELDCLVSPQMLVNIFEHNTPLHDGAIIIRGKRIVAATCYLPLSDNMSLSKALGTRHRAAIGMSEVSDAIVIVVSEETGRVSCAIGGKLTRGISQDELREMLQQVQDTTEENRKFKLKKGKDGNDRQVKK